MRNGEDIGMATPTELLLAWNQWNRNGKELFYAFGANTALANHAVSADGQRFIIVKNDPGASHLNVVLNWFNELTQRTALK